MTLNRFIPRILLATLVLIGGCDSGPTFPAVSLDLRRPWAVSPPEHVDLDPVAMAAAVAQADAIPRFRSLLVVRRGRLAVESYFHGASEPTLHDVRSVTKSVVGMLTGIAIERGHLTLNTRIGDVIGSEIATIPSGHAAITVRDLLTMSSGLAWDETTGSSYSEWIASADRIQYMFDLPLVNTPGSTFTYNSGAVHLLGVMLEETVGQSLPSFADEALFGLSGISESRWEASTGGRVNGGAGLDLRARDLARLGQLMLQEGVSGDDQVLPFAWRQASTMPAYDWRSSIGPITSYTYGRLWWVHDTNPQAYYAWGYGGQFVYVVPSLELVVVSTTEWRGVSGDGGATPLEAATLEIIVNHVVAGAR